MSNNTEQIVYIPISINEPPEEQWHGIINKHGVVRQAYWNGEIWILLDGDNADAIYWLKPVPISSLQVSKELSDEAVGFLKEAQSQLGKSILKTATSPLRDDLTEINILLFAAVRDLLPSPEPKERVFIAAEIETIYKTWLKETKRGGSVSLGKSVNEFFAYITSLK